MQSSYPRLDCGAWLRLGEQCSAGMSDVGNQQPHTVLVTACYDKRLEQKLHTVCVLKVDGSALRGSA